ncbi:hypothetical protein AB0P21_39880 [Kribbella sp. NPDC056861]|uniref:hypothetical protein n=1 Tax=Kribbella sp. NPDC056861 TaxID=3154857 RepID=UPI00343F7689
MAVLHLDFPEIERVSLLMTRASEQMAPEIEHLRLQIVELTNNGMRLEKGGPALLGAYTDFNTNLQAAVAGIETFAKSIAGIGKAGQEMDTSIQHNFNKVGSPTN